MDRKKELKLQYKQMKPDMGIFIIRCKNNNKCFINAVHDLRGAQNGALVRLGAGMHPNKELQKEWKEYGSDAFTIEVLETLKYDKDEIKTDYTEELTLLQMIWEEKLTEQGLVFYQKRI
jgi:hypothetical protein